MRSRRIATFTPSPGSAWPTSGGQQVAAALVHKAGRPADPAALDTDLAEHLSHFRIRRLWQIVDSLRLTAIGKVRKV